MSSFPTLSRQPILGGISETPQADVVYYESETGPDVSRIGTTRPYISIPIQFKFLAAADLALLRSWWTNCRAEFVDWTAPDATTWTVRPKQPYTIALSSGRDDLYDVTIQFRGHRKDFGSGLFGAGIFGA